MSDALNNMLIVVEVTCRPRLESTGWMTKKGKSNNYSMIFKFE